MTYLIEDNELEKMAERHRKKQNGISPFLNKDAGDVEKSVEFFNRVNGVSTDAPAASTDGQSCECCEEMIQECNKKKYLSGMRKSLKEIEKESFENDGTYVGMCDLFEAVANKLDASQVTFLQKAVNTRDLDVINVALQKVAGVQESLDEDDDVDKINNYEDDYTWDIDNDFINVEDDDVYEMQECKKAKTISESLKSLDSYNYNNNLKLYDLYNLYESIKHSLTKADISDMRSILNEGRFSNERKSQSVYKLMESKLIDRSEFYGC